MNHVGYRLPANPVVPGHRRKVRPSGQFRHRPRQRPRHPRPPRGPRNPFNADPAVRAHHPAWRVGNHQRQVPDLQVPPLPSRGATLGPANPQAATTATRQPASPRLDLGDQTLAFLPHLPHPMGFQSQPFPDTLLQTHRPCSFPSCVTNHTKETQVPDASTTYIHGYSRYNLGRRAKNVRPLVLLTMACCNR
jgi:hypothetical protein